MIDYGFVYHILLHDRFISFQSKGIQCHHLGYKSCDWLGVYVSHSPSWPIYQLSKQRHSMTSFKVQIMWLIMRYYIIFSFRAYLLAFKANVFSVIIQSTDNVIDQGFVYHILLHGRFISFQSRGIQCHHQSTDHVIDQGFMYHILLHDRFIIFQSKGIQCHHLEYGLSKLMIDQGFVYYTLLCGRFISF